LAFVFNARASANNAETPTATGHSLTWKQVDSVTAGPVGDRRLTCFRAMGAAPTAGALTLDFGSQMQDLCAWSVFEYDKVDTSGANGAGAVVQRRNQNGTGVMLSVGLNPFDDPTNNLAVGGVILSLLMDPVKPITPGAGFTEIHEQSPNQPGGKSGTLQTQDRVGASSSVNWSWNGAENAAAIGLEIKAAVETGTGGNDLEQLVRRFEPVLFFHPQEAFYPSNAKRYIEHAALWKVEAPFDTKSSWGGLTQPFPKSPLIPARQIAALDNEPGNYLGDPNNLVDTEREERFLELGGWKDKAETPQPNLTATSANTYANRGSIFNLYMTEPGLNNSRFWYHAEVFDTDRLKRLTSPFRAPDLLKVFESLKNPTLLCYYLFFPAHEQSVGAGCTNIEAREVGAFAGEWSCITLMLERDTAASPYRPTFIGHTGSQTSVFELTPGNWVRRPQSFDDKMRSNMKVEKWRPGTGFGAALPEVIEDHPRLFVSLGTHSLYLESGSHNVDPFPDDAKSQQCGRFDTPSLMPKDPDPDDDFWEDVGAFLAKVFSPWLLALGPWGLIAGIVAAAVEGVLPTPGGLTVVGTMDFAPDDQTATAGAGKTIRPGGLNVSDAGTDVEDWRSAQGVQDSGRRYDYLVNRTTQVWWPSDDLRSGYQGRWGQRVENDPLPRRGGMRFPQFWKMFFLAMADGKTTGLL